MNITVSYSIGARTWTRTFVTLAAAAQFADVMQALYGNVEIEA